jgi:hypothetical protein
MERKNYKALQIAAVAENKWIIEGSSPSVLKTMDDRVDWVIILNLPPMGNIMRITKRYLKGKFLKETRIGWSGSMSEVNEIHLDFLYKTLRWRSRQLPRIRENIRNAAMEGRMIEIHSLKNMFDDILHRIKDIS